MNKNNPKIKGIILGFFLFILPLSVSATTYFEDNFNSYSAGTSLYNQSHTLYYEYFGNYSLGKLYPYYEGVEYGNSLRLGVGGNWDGLFSADFSSHLTGNTAYFTFYIREANGAHDLYPRIDMCSTYNSNHLCNPGGTANYVSWGIFGNDIYFNTDGGYSLHYVGTPHDGNFHKYQIQYDFSLNQVSGYYDDNLIGTGTLYKYGSPAQDYKSFVIAQFGNSDIYIDNISLVSSLSTNGQCGSANNQTYRALPTDSGVLCSAGTPTSSIFSFDSGWLWTCEGINGGSTDVCHATFDNNATAINAVCGSDDGQTLSSTPTNLCTTGDLITPSLVSTQTGWTWTCAGVDGGNNANCSASNSTFIFPTTPAPTDCSALSVPDKWFCDISNTIKGIFLPSDTAIKTLNNTMDGIKQKAPFCYITAMENDLAMLQVAKNTTGSSIDMTFGWGQGNTGTINLDTFGSSGYVRDFMVYIRAIVSFIIILIFIFWVLGYMKRVFK